MEPRCEAGAKTDVAEVPEEKAPASGEEEKTAAKPVAEPVKKEKPVKPAESKPKKTAAKAKTKAKTEAKTEAKTPESGDIALSLQPITDSSNKNERVLALHKQGKSNVAIAKELGLGVGEVKLIIDLFKEM